MLKIVGIGEYSICKNKEDIIKTYALGSCVAVSIYCKPKMIMAMAHMALPDYILDNEAQQKAPAYFVNKALPFIIEKLIHEFKCNKDELDIYVFGGANSNYKNDIFNIGIKNVNKVKEILNYYKLKYDISNTGGNFSRTVEIYAATGNFKLKLYPIKI